MLAGGPLSIEIDDDLRVFMTGPAEIVFTGQVDASCVPCEDPC
jgi:diaminopimelate epimerase